MGRPRSPRAELVVQLRGATLRGGTRAEQRSELVAQLAGRLRARPGITVDWTSLSVAARTVTIVVDDDLVAEVRRSLQATGLRVDDAVERQIVDESTDGGDW